MCEDLPKPARPESTLVGRVSEELEKWDTTAQYSLSISKWDWNMEIGGFYPLQTARRIRTLFEEAIQKSRPHETTWTLPLVGIKLRQPIVSANGRGTVGDMVIYRFDTEAKRYAGDALVASRHWVAAFAATVDDDGGVLEIEGINGRRQPTPRRYVVVPMSQFVSREVVRDELSRRHAEFKACGLHYPATGFFGSPHLLLAGAMRTHLAILPAGRIDVASVIERTQAATCTHPLKLALPINVVALQRQVDVELAMVEPMARAA